MGLVVVALRREQQAVQQLMDECPAPGALLRAGYPFYDTAFLCSKLLELSCVKSCLPGALPAQWGSGQHMQLMCGMITAVWQSTPTLKAWMSAAFPGSKALASFRRGPPELNSK